jgi:FMN phosphatase YigB (HAD superfamily)
VKFLTKDHGECVVNTRFWGTVIPAQAGIHCGNLDSRLRGNDKQRQSLVLTSHQLFAEVLIVLSLAEYSDALDSRDVIWPRPEEIRPVKAKASIEPLPGIRAILWDVYGTLLRITGGRFQWLPKEEVRLQIALDRTIHEFNMWNSMYRRPGPPWQSMIGLYQSTAERQAMVGTARGDYPEVDLCDVWSHIVDRLHEKEYQYDADLMGDQQELSEKIAFFFHSCLQGMEARSGAVQCMRDFSEAGLIQGVLADGQSFTLVQLLRGLASQATLPPLHELFRPETILFSTQLGLRKPSGSFFELAVSRLRSLGISPGETLHVSCRLKTDLVPAKAVGMKTALLVAEKSGLEVSAELLKMTETRPDRLLTDLSQMKSIVGFTG